MKDAARLVLYLAGVLLVGALLAPLLFWLGQWVIAQGFWPRLARYDFHSYFDRAVLIAALVLLWPLFRSFRVRSWGDLELEKNPFAGADLGVGFAAAALPLLCGGAVLAALPIYSLRHPFLWQKMPAVLIAALVVPVLEELLFRGFILGVLLRSCSRVGAVVLTSALFAIVHFVKPPAFLPNESVHWWTGFIALGRSFAQFGEPLLFVGGFCTLFVVACILADARLLTRSLWLPIGLHAGWIFANGVFSRAAHRDLLALPWLGKDFLVGIVPLCIALLSWALMRGWVNYPRRRPLPSPPRTH
ncbi:MAG TPA: CPBP family intramembrane glutamic endopeptidase [Chthoniobacterales bacterium]